MITQRPYEVPKARTYKDWCKCLGLTPEPYPENLDVVISYDDFCFFPNTVLRKERDGELYGFWRKYGDVWGESRTVKEWLEDFKWVVAEPTTNDLRDMNLFLGHDAFWEWSSGKIEHRTSTTWDQLKKLFKRKKQ